MREVKINYNRKKINYIKFALSSPYYFFDFLIWFITHSFPIFIGLLYKNLFDNMEVKADFVQFKFLILALLLTLITNVIMIYIGFSVDTRFKLSLKNYLIRNITKNNLNTIDSGDTIDIINQDIEVLVGSITYFIDMLCNLISSIVAIIIICRINKILFLFMLFPIFSSYAMSKIKNKNYTRKIEENRENDRKISSSVYNYIKNYEMIKMMGFEDRAIKEIEEKNNLQKKLGYEKSKIEVSLSVLNTLLNSITMSLILIFMIKPIKSGDITVGDFTLFVSYVVYIENFTIYLVNYLMNRKSREVSVQNINGIISGSVKKFENVEIPNIKDYEFALIVGPNGSGKSYYVEKIAKNNKLHLVSQRPNLINGSIKENIILDKDYDKEEFERAINIACLKEDEFRGGFETIAGFAGNELSGGQKFRIALARAVYDYRDILIVDGGLNSLNITVRYKVLEELLKNFCNKLIITTSDYNFKKFDYRYNYIELMSRGRSC